SQVWPLGGARGSSSARYCLFWCEPAQSRQRIAAGRGGGNRARRPEPRQSDRPVWNREDSGGLSGILGWRPHRYRTPAEPFGLDLLFLPLSPGCIGRDRAFPVESSGAVFYVVAFLDLAGHSVFRRSSFRASGPAPPLFLAAALHPASAPPMFCRDVEG